MEIPNHPNYICYPDGRIYNKKRKYRMATSLSKGGYEIVNISKNGKAKILTIHRILALLYIENPNNLPNVDHYDGNRSNNCLSNLRWVNQSENQRNSKLPKNNTSGHIGIQKYTNRKNEFYYRAFWYLPFNPKTKKQKRGSKTFKSLEEAIKHRRKMETIYYPSMNQSKHK